MTSSLLFSITTFAYLISMLYLFLRLALPERNKKIQARRVE